MLQAMSGQGRGFGPDLLDGVKSVLLLGGLITVVWGLPNSMAIMSGRKNRLAWRPAWAHALLSGAMAVAALVFMQSHLGKQFIYFDL